MVEMQVSQEHIGNIARRKSIASQGAFQAIVSVQVVMAEEFFTLFVPDSVVDKYAAIAIDHQHTAHREVDLVVFVGRIHFVPDGFGHYAKHGTAIELEVAGRDCVKFHYIYL